MERKTAYILDASVVVKWYSLEENRDKALEIRQRYFLDEIELILADLILYELPNALKYGAKFNQTQIKEAIYNLLDLEILIVAPQPIIISRSIELSSQLDITYYDAYYIALAELLGYELVLADEKLYKKIEHLPFIKLLQDF